MAQHVGYSRGPATFLLVLGLFHLVNVVVPNEIGAVKNPRIHSVRLIDRHDDDSNNSAFAVGTVSSGLLVDVEGSELNGDGDDDDLPLRWSPNDSECDANRDPLRKVGTIGNHHFYRLPENCCFEVTTVYFCLRTVTRDGDAWYNLGGNFAVRPHNNE